MKNYGLNKLLKHEEEIKQYVNEQELVCSGCMPSEGSETVWFSAPWTLSDTVASALLDLDLLQGSRQKARVEKIARNLTDVLDLFCTHCRSPWKASTLVASNPWETSVDTNFLRKRPKIQTSRENVLVAYGDITGFSAWSKRGVLSESAFRDLMKKFIQELLSVFDREDMKFLGDGFLIATELKLDDDSASIASIVGKLRQLNASMEGIIRSSPSPRPAGFRIRISLGEVWKLTFTLNRTKKIEYLGYSVNLASRLLGVRKDIGVICAENVKEKIEGSGPFKFKRVRVNPKGMPEDIDRQDYESLWEIL